MIYNRSRLCISHFFPFFRIKVHYTLGVATIDREEEALLIYLKLTSTNSFDLISSSLSAAIGASPPQQQHRPQLSAFVDLPWHLNYYASLTLLIEFHRTIITLLLIDCGCPQHHTHFSIIDFNQSALCSSRLTVTGDKQYSQPVSPHLHSNLLVTIGCCGYGRRAFSHTAN